MPNHAPIWTQVGVEALGLPTMRFEIRVTAIIH
jgi:enamine deaminase RidA (YjgF/YER057c/UK114 family)